MLSLIEDWSGYDTLICVDAAGPIGAPGRIHRLDLASDDLPRRSSVASSHALSLAEVIDLARILHSAPQHIIVYAVEGSLFDAGAAITAAAAAAADEVASRVAAEIRELLQIRTAPVSHA
jgi:hydrogenase maturation protease